MKLDGSGEMTIDEAIKHAKKVAEEQEKAAQEWHENQIRKCELIRFAEMDYTRENECKKCAEEHRQLAEWLKELKAYKEQEPKTGTWINEKWHGLDLIGVTCSNCYVVESRFSKYCPNCGAKMAESEE